MNNRAPHLLLAACLLAAAPACASSVRDSLGASPLAAKASRPSPYREHAPLAWFSLGSIAVGGVFYGIQENMSGPRVNYVAGDRSRMTLAIGAAAATALAAAGAWLYFSHASAKSAWDTRLSGGVDEGGRVHASAALVFPLPGD